MSAVLTANLGSVLNAGAGAATGIAGMLYNANQSRLQFERSQWLLQRESEINEDAAKSAYERELQADATKYQRSVADMKAAGLNPMLVAGSGAGAVHSSPSSASASSPVAASSPNLSGLMDALRLNNERRLTDANVTLAKSEAAVNKAKEDNITADTAKKREETRLVASQADINEATKDAQIESRRLRNELDRKQMKEIDSKIDEISAHIHLLEEQATTEDSKRQAALASAMLSRASAYEIVQMLPYRKQLLAAQTEEARQAAALSAAHAAYQNGLLTEGYLDAFVAKAQADAKTSEAVAERAAIAAAIRTGDFSKQNTLKRIPVISDIEQGLALMLDNFNPLDGFLSAAR